jgi:hypothetical protein
MEYLSELCINILLYTGLPGLRRAKCSGFRARKRLKTSLLIPIMLFCTLKFTSKMAYGTYEHDERTSLLPTRDEDITSAKSPSGTVSAFATFG